MISVRNGADNQAWWHVFEDPFINQLVSTAYQENVPLRVAALRVMEADLQREIVLGSLFPQTQQGYGEVEWIQNSLQGNRFGFRNRDRFLTLFSTGLRATWELDFWESIHASVAR